MIDQRKIWGYDSVVIDQPVNDQAKSDALGILERDKGTKLKLSIDATHAGVITNGRVYPSKFVSTGYKSFFDQENGGTAKYNKPILLHHDHQEDPIGRVTGGQFTALKVGKDFDEDYASPDDSGGRGSGVVTVNGFISDPTAIKKILDGRYLTVSSGHSTNKMLCSICGCDIFDKKLCSHLPGKRYKLDEDDSDDDIDYLCYGITNKMTYHEVSFVNLPAQPPAKVINFAWEDAKEPDFWSTDSIRMVHNILRGKKEVIKNLVLCDEDVEYSLLTSKDKQRVSKTTVTVPPSTVDLLKESFDEQVEAEETSDSTESRLPEKKKSASSEEDSEETADVNKDRTSDAEDTNAEGNQTATQQKVNQKTDPEQDDQHNGEPDMKDEKDTKNEELSPNAMKASLEALTQERDSLKTQISDKNKEIEDLKKKNEGIESENKRLVDDAAAREGDTAKQLAHSVAAVRIILDKPDATEVSNRETFEAFVEKLAERSVDSLLDSIADHALELAQLDELKSTKDSENTDDGDEGDSMADDQVTSPALGNNEESSKKTLSKEDYLNFD